MHFRFKLELFRKPSQNPKQHQYNTTYITYLDRHHTLLMQMT